MLGEFIRAFFIIFIAEMGDKTQILAMAFATKFSVRKVMLGIFLGSLVNHGLAIALGSYLTKIVPMEYIHIVAGLAFVFFSLWSIKPENSDDEDENIKVSFNPVFTVALAFFIGELGDKTQLTAITLSVDSISPIITLIGTVTGMVVTGGIGVFVGKKLGDKVPEFVIKLLASVVFMAFGLYKLVNIGFDKELYLVAVPLIVIIYSYMMLKSFKNRRKESLYKKQSKKLQEYYLDLDKKIENICSKDGKCGVCKGNECIVGNSKTIINNIIEEKKEDIEVQSELVIPRRYDEKLVEEVIAFNNEIIDISEDEKVKKSLTIINKNLKKIKEADV